MDINQLRHEIGTENNGYHGFLRIEVIETELDDDGKHVELVKMHGTIEDVHFDEERDCVVFTVGAGRIG